MLTSYFRHASILTLAILFPVSAHATDTLRSPAARPRLTAPVPSDAAKNRLRVKTPAKSHILSRKADINVKQMVIDPTNLELTGPDDEKRVRVYCGFDNIGTGDSGPVVLRVHLAYSPNVPSNYTRGLAKTVNNIPAKSSGKPMGTSVNAPHIGKYYQFDAGSHLAPTHVNSPYPITCSATPLAHETGSLATNNTKTGTVKVKRTY